MVELRSNIDYNIVFNVELPVNVFRSMELPVPVKKSNCRTLLPIHLKLIGVKADV